MIKPADQHDGGDDMRRDDTERAAAQLAEAVAHHESEPMPADVARRLKAKLADVSSKQTPASEPVREVAERHATRSDRVERREDTPRRSTIGRIGFGLSLVAAACLVVLIARTMPGRDPGGVGSITDQRTQFRQVATDLRTMRWRPNRDDPAVLSLIHI